MAMVRVLFHGHIVKALSFPWHDKTIKCQGKDDKAGWFSLPAEDVVHLQSHGYTIEEEFSKARIAELAREAEASKKAEDEAKAKQEVDEKAKANRK